MISILRSHTTIRYTSEKFEFKSYRARLEPKNSTKLNYKWYIIEKGIDRYMEQSDSGSCFQHFPMYLKFKFQVRIKYERYKLSNFLFHTRMYPQQNLKEKCLYYYNLFKEIKKSLKLEKIISKLYIFWWQMRIGKRCPTNLQKIQRIRHHNNSYKYHKK